MFVNRRAFEGSLFENFRRLEREMNHLFDAVPRSEGNNTSSRSYPPLNVRANESQVNVYLFAPGIDSKRVEITLDKNLLTIKGERNTDLQQGAQHYRRERFNGQFYRAVNLPEDVDPERVEANYTDGVLHVTIQRHEAPKPRQIEVQ